MNLDGLDPAELEARIELEIAIRERKAAESERVRQDWYGSSCLDWGCPHYDHARLRCPEHPRARPMQRPPLDPLSSARPLHRMDPDLVRVLLGKDEAESFLEGVMRALERGPIEDDPWVWLSAAGRGAGKTRTGSEWCHWVVRQLVEGEHVRVDRGEKAMIALVGETIGDVVRVMIEGPSGLIATQKQGYRVEYQPSKSRVVWYDDEGREVGIGIIASCQEYGRLRGPQFHASWADELAKWKYTQGETWEQIQLSTRLAPSFGILVTTTPQPTATYKEILFDPHTHVSTGSTYENAANLDPVFFLRIRARFEGTSLGAQELYATLLGDDEGAIWNRALIDLARELADAMPRDAKGLPVGIAWERRAVGVDPNASGNGDEAGIVVAAAGRRGAENLPRGLVIADMTVSGGPNQWARRAVQALVEWHADVIVVERNNGGEMCELVIRSACKELHAEDPSRYPPSVPIRTVWASRGKRARAEPVKSLYEQSRILHAARFAELEEEMRTWRPDSGQQSPNRLDALVWALTFLLVEGKVPPSAPAGGAYASAPSPSASRPRAQRPAAAMPRSARRPRLGTFRRAR